MIYKAETYEKRRWRDDVLFTRYLQDSTYEQKMLSKCKFLNKIAEQENINEIHMLLLDNITKLHSICYYDNTEDFIMSLTTNTKIIVTLSLNDFYSLLVSCSNN